MQVEEGVHLHILGERRAADTPSVPIATVIRTRLSLAAFSAA